MGNSFDSPDAPFRLGGGTVTLLPAGAEPPKDLGSGRALMRATFRFDGTVPTVEYLEALNGE